MSSDGISNTDNEKLTEYFAEALESLASIKKLLMELHKNSLPEALLDELLIHCSIIYNISGFPDIPQAEQLSQLSKSILSMITALKEKRVEPEEEVIDMLIAAVETAEDIFDSLSRGEEINLDVEELVSGIEFLMDERNDLMEEFKMDSGVSIPAAEEPAFDTSSKEFKFFADAVHQHLLTIEEAVDLLKVEEKTDCLEWITRSLQGIKGASGFINHMEMKMRAEALQEEMTPYNSKPVSDFMSSELMQDILDFASGIKELIDQEAGADEAADAKTLPADFISEDTAGLLQEDPPSLPKAETPHPVELPESISSSSSLVEEPSKIKTAKKEKRAKVQESKDNEILKVEIDKIDRLMNSIEELMTLNTKILNVKHMVGNDPQLADYSKKLNSLVTFFDKLTEQLYNQMISVRMQPVKSLFGKFKNVIDTLSREQNKKIDVFTRGEDTEIDRVVLESLKDPLIHLIRNAVDHGVETPQDRKDKGKSERGRVNLRAFNDVNSVVIEIEDDGKGIDPARVLKKAIEKGLVESEDAKHMTKQEILDLIFRPGFSTAEMITDLSGRGVGMDVVKTNVHKHGGSIYIHTAKGKGSTFVIRLPLSMSMVDTLIVRGGEELFAIPTDGIEKILKIPKESFKTIYKKRVLPLNGSTLPFHPLSDMFDMNGYSCNNDKPFHLVAVIKSSSKKIALGLDEIIGKQKVVIKNIGSFLKKVRGISGAYIQGDGRIILVVNIADMLISSAA